MKALQARRPAVSIFFTVRRVLVVDDEENLRLVLRTLLRRHGYEVETASSGEEALGLVDSFGPDVILTDVRMPKMGGLDLLTTLKAKGNEATVIVMSAYGNMDMAIEAMKAGAYDYVQKPFKPDEVVLTLRKAEERESLRRENRALRDEIRKENKFEDILAKSQKMTEIFRTISKIADYKTTVLVTGESGVGKELIARAIHRRSSRRGGPFIAVNCGAIPENLLESELFGHKKGAFTDAIHDRRGLFEEASGGSLFLDEIGELPLGLQVKLLRVLEDEKIRRLGEARDIQVDVRIITATHRDLMAETKAGRFREDLFYRLNVLPIHCPPLRERREDVAVLARHFLAQANAGLSRPCPGFQPSALEKLAAHGWPGNVRELENRIKQAAMVADGREIRPEHVLLDSPAPSGAATLTGLLDAGLSFDEARDRFEREVLVQVLRANHGAVTRAADALRIHRNSLYHLLRKHGLDFFDADAVFEGLTVTVEDDREAYGEQRLVTLGFLGSEMIRITHTERAGSIRIISMRKATRHEAKLYFAQIAD